MGQAEAWDKPRRVVLVVKEREGDLLLDRFFLVTSLSWTVKLRHEVLAHYRERGKAEGHMGELKDVLAPALSSTNRAKSHRRGKTLKSKTPAVDARRLQRGEAADLLPRLPGHAHRPPRPGQGERHGLEPAAAARAGAEGRRAAGGLGAPDDAGDLLGRSTVRSALWPGLLALHWADP